jgi:hypothetical protein
MSIEKDDYFIILWIKINVLTNFYIYQIPPLQCLANMTHRLNMWTMYVFFLSSLQFHSFKHCERHYITQAMFVSLLTFFFLFVSNVHAKYFYASPLHKEWWTNNILFDRLLIVCWFLFIHLCSGKHYIIAWIIRIHICFVSLNVYSHIIRKYYESIICNVSKKNDAMCEYCNNSDSNYSESDDSKALK